MDTPFPGMDKIGQKKKNSLKYFGILFFSDFIRFQIGGKKIMEIINIYRIKDFSSLKSAQKYMEDIKKEGIEGQLIYDNGYSVRIIKKIGIKSQ